MTQTNHPRIDSLKAITLSLVLSIAISSCVTTKKTTYLQDYGMNDSIAAFTPESYTIQPNDNLFIRVTTPDPRWSEMFNTLPVSSPTVSTTEQSVDLLSYSVQLDGTVEIPYLGSVEVAGKTLVEARELLEKNLEDYISDAAITVKLVNNFVSILGEVSVPGVYPIYKEQLNIFQAIAMAGDADDFGNRFEVQIVRSTPDGSVIKNFDLTDRSILDSEFYYIMPNDVIYIKPMKGKFFAMNQFPFALILTSISTTILFLGYIRPANQ